MALLVLALEERVPVLLYLGESPLLVFTLDLPLSDVAMPLLFTVFLL